MDAADEIARTEHIAKAFQEFAAKTGDGSQVRRLPAIALRPDGHSRKAAAERGRDGHAPCLTPPPWRFAGG